MNGRELAKRLTAEAAKLGFDVGTIDTSRRHQRLPLTWPGGRMFIVFSHNPSDHRAWLQARAHLRRTARHAGIA